VSGLEVSESTGETVISTPDPAPKRSRLKMPVDQKGSWPSIPGKGPIGDPEDTTTKSPEEFTRIICLSESG
jgi:hypothetical protein